MDVDLFTTTPPPPVPWVAYPSLAAARALTLISAKPGLGKTWLSLAISTALSSQRKIAGMSNGGKPHGVLYIDAENGTGVLRRRIFKLGCNPRLLDVRDAEGFTLNNLDALHNILTQVRPSLVVFDSFASLWHGNENDQEEVSTCLNGIREVLQDRGPAGILIHHDSRYGGAYRGSGAIAACCEVVIQMAGTDRCIYDRVLTWEKCRLDETPDRFGFNLREIIGNANACDCYLCRSLEQSVR